MSEFLKRHIGPSEEEQTQMLNDLGLSSLDELVREVVPDSILLRGDQDKLVHGQNWDKFHLDNIISWWKRKATKRYETLKKDGRFRDKVELWSQDEHIQIIR